jgi:hypothetical protein
LQPKANSKQLLGMKRAQRAFELMYTADKQKRWELVCKLDKPYCDWCCFKEPPRSPPTPPKDEQNGGKKRKALTTESCSEDEECSQVPSEKRAKKSAQQVLLFPTHSTACF